MAESPRPILRLLDQAMALLREGQGALAPERPGGQAQQEALAVLEALRATLVAED